MNSNALTSLLRTEDGNKSWLRELLEFALIIVLVVLPFRYFVAEPYIVSGVSMSDTYETGHYLIINKFWHRMSEIERGDILVFRSPVEPEKFYIKRVVGLPGELININNSAVSITPETSSSSFVLTEPYTKNKTFASMEVLLEDDEYFMMGDNRLQSYDSRAWGPLKEELIRGEPVLRLFPFSQIDLMPGRYHTTSTTSISTDE